MSRMICKTCLLIFGLFLLNINCLYAVNLTKGNVVVIEQLVQRLLPGQSDKFVFSIDTKSKNKFYRISSKNGRVYIKGDSPVSIASGLHRYMREYLHAEVSWTNWSPQIPVELPLPKVSVYEESPYSFVTYMNYCTFGYTTVYWDWERWEKEIDWMALHGITHPLSLVGVEQVWRNFLSRVGYTDEEAKNFLTGPVYLPWLLMGNMETLGGPMPEEWFDRQVKLQHKILGRMRDYGMEPIFQAFYGMIPSDYKKKYPHVKIIEQGKWNTFDRPDVLSPLDVEFKRLAKIWYEEYEKLFGRTDYYAGDLFHEGGKSAGLDITACARSVEREMCAYNPNAVWVLQSWGANPFPELLKGLNPDHAIVVELCAEYWHRWKDKGGYEGIPWAWSNISNWGGNIGLHGRLDAIATEPVEALNDRKTSKTLRGIGFTPEGIETNPIVPSLWSDMVWTEKTPDMSLWVKQYSQNRYGVVLPSLERAWCGFYETAYGTYEGSRRPSESVFCASPSLEVKTVSSWSQCKIFYEPEAFADACSVFLQDAVMLEDNKNYQYDVVDMVRQYLSNLGRSSYATIQKAWQNKDKELFNKEVDNFLGLIKDQDKLLLSHPSFCFHSWLQSARDASADVGMANQYEYYNKLIVTSWDVNEGSLNDYAHRELGGVLGSYYYKRWRLYFNYLKQAWDNPSMPKPYIFGVTSSWLYEDIEDAIKPSDRNPVKAAVEVFDKYYSGRAAE